VSFVRTIPDNIDELMPLVGAGDPSIPIKGPIIGLGWPFRNGRWPFARPLYRDDKGVWACFCVGAKGAVFVQKGNLLEKRQKKKAFFGLEGLRGEEGWEG